MSNIPLLENDALCAYLWPKARKGQYWFALPPIYWCRLLDKQCILSIDTSDVCPLVKNGEIKPKGKK